MKGDTSSVVEDHAIYQGEALSKFTQQETNSGDICGVKFAKADIVLSGCGSKLQEPRHHQRLGAPKRFTQVMENTLSSQLSVSGCRVSIIQFILYLLSVKFSPVFPCFLIRVLPFLSAA